MIKQLDKYIIRKFLTTFFFSIALIIVIVIIFDISEKIDDFLEKDAPLKEIIFSYYFNFIPYFVNLFSPLFTFIAVIFFTAKLAANTEIVAILSSGISFRRFLVPYVVASAIIGLLSFYLTNFLIPPTNQKRLNFEDHYMKHRSAKTNRDIHMQIEPGTFVYINYFSDLSKNGFGFTLEKYIDNKLTFKLQGNSLRWDTISKKWEILDYTIRHIDGLKESMKRGVKMDTALNLKPQDLISNTKIADAMDYFQLRDHIKKERLRGSDNIVYFEVEHQKRMANPFSTIILAIIGVSLSSRKVRGGIGLHIGAGILISFSYILFMQVSQTFATNGNLPVLVAVWIPNLLFGLLAIYLVKKAPK